MVATPPWCRRRTVVVHPSVGGHPRCCRNCSDRCIRRRHQSSGRRRRIDTQPSHSLQLLLMDLTNENNRHRFMFTRCLSMRVVDYEGTWNHWTRFTIVYFKFWRFQKCWRCGKFQGCMGLWYPDPTQPNGQSVASRWIDVVDQSTTVRFSLKSSVGLRRIGSRLVAKSSQLATATQFRPIRNQYAASLWLVFDSRPLTDYFTTATRPDWAPRSIRSRRVAVFVLC